ncbi:hypothetical protein M433DRAFT_113840 [Acidomyces richmondensis BFW]|nr:MAG: hypothetical protein FE78DRAFT_141849 [Acidomyces sp. 'richmondensis']KYG42503.1 hypothetical protein M433DRAFT_113840 [Acidomyces richmondensis BFW]
MSAFHSSQHQHSGSADSSSAGSSYQLILDHILTYPASYEIPLRTMYQLNCAPRSHQVQPRNGNVSSSAGSSPAHPQGAFPDDQTTHTFQENLMAQLQQAPNQPTCLPPSFITSFLQRCFPPELICVDFPQALTGLDYLKDLEMRRRREVAAAMNRLEIDRTTLNQDAATLSNRYPGVIQWVTSMEEKERKVEALYTQLYVVLRRWIMINELSLIPFNKHNCVAMLNTLYPPVMSTLPTSKLTPSVLQAQRSGFFKYIQSVEKSGPRILNNLMQQGKAPTDENGWIAVTRTLSLYLQLAKSIINECSDIADIQDVSPRKKRESGESRKSRKADSGVSFGSTDRPSTRSSSASEFVSPTGPSRPKTPSGGRSGSALEKIARGLKTIGRSRTDPKGLRKMRSMGSLEYRKTHKSAPKAAEQPAFDAEMMRTQRMKHEALSAAGQKFDDRLMPFEV